MISLEKARIAKLTKNGNNFEILVDPVLSRKLKTKKDLDFDFDNLIASDEIFSDAKKGRLAGNLELHFPNKTRKEIIKYIVIYGKIEYTRKELSELREKLKSKIISYIHNYAIDSSTKLPIPKKRIEMLFDELKIRLDINRSFDKELNVVIDKLRPHIPIKISKKKIVIKVPPHFSNKVCSYLKKKVHISCEKWLNDGSYYAQLEVFSGQYVDLLNKLNNYTKGTIEVEDIN